MANGINLKGLENSIKNLTNANPLNQSQQFKTDGFLLPNSYSSDGTGLPSSNVHADRPAQLKRNIITWFIPQFGIVRMYVNPSSIVYTDKKLIQKDRTKGGFTLQYWGEELTTIAISGTTGSSGIEGINVLHEIYRAEQYAFDATGLTLAANNATADLSNNITSTGAAVAGGVGSALLNGISGMDSPNNTLSANNIPSLAQLAFTVEMYYNGWVYRGYFDNMTMNEKAETFLLEYQMTFIATQRRGYRTNYFPWSKSAVDGPSRYDTAHSLSGNITSGK